jgi:hypothetical protein
MHRHGTFQSILNGFYKFIEIKWFLKKPAAPFSNASFFVDAESDAVIIIIGVVAIAIISPLSLLLRCRLLNSGIIV